MPSQVCACSEPARCEPLSFGVVGPRVLQHVGQSYIAFPTEHREDGN